MTAPSHLSSSGHTPGPVGYACAEHLSRRAEYERNGSVIYAKPSGTATLPLYAGPAAAAAAELLEAAINLRDAQRAYMAMRREPGEMREALGQAVAAHAAVLDAALTKAIASEVGHD